MSKRINKATAAGGLIILFFLFVAVLAPLIAPHKLTEMVTGYLPPSREHLLGTNDVGQDIFSEMIYGTRVSLEIGIFAAFTVTFIGTVLAMIAGYFGGPADKAITALTNIAMSVPSLPLTVLLAAYLRPGKASIILAISITSWTGTARILRSRVQQLCRQPFVRIEKTMGVHPAVILFKHLLPNMKDIILTRGALAVSSAMLTESSLSFLGLGSYSEKSWGGVLHYAFFHNSIIKRQYWWFVPPIVCICAAVMGFLLIGYYGEAGKKTGSARKKGGRRPGFPHRSGSDRSGERREDGEKL